MDEVDAFKLVNCPLPDISLHLLLHRTRLIRPGQTQTSRIRVIRLESLQRQTVNETHLQLLLQNLDQVEQFSLENYELLILAPKMNRVSRHRREIGTTGSSSPSSGSSASLPSSTRQMTRKPARNHVNSRIDTMTSTPFTVVSITSTPPDSSPSISRLLRFSNTRFALILPSSSTAATVSVSSTVAPTGAGNRNPSTFPGRFSSNRLEPTTWTSTTPTPAASTVASESLSPVRITSRQPSFSRRPPGPTSLSPSSIPVSVNGATTLAASASNAIRLASTGSLPMTLSNSIQANQSTTPSFPVAVDSSPAGQTKPFKFNLAQLLPALRSLQLRSFLMRPERDNALYLRHILANLRLLETLELTGNVLSKLPAGTFSSLTRLRTLHLNHNHIESMHPTSLQAVRNLEVLELFNNRLATLPAELLQDAVALRVLRLRRNRLTSLPAALLHSSTRLQQIDLSQNPRLTQLPLQLLATSSQLQNLTISDCGLTQLSSDPIRFLSTATDLRQLHMRNNRLKHLSWPGLFSAQFNLVSLDISYNDIREVAPDLFPTKTSRLIELNLFGNDLLRVPDELFSSLRALRTLNLGYNNLTQVPARALLPLTSLQQLDLSRNHIRSLMTNNPGTSQSPFGVGAALRAVSLAGNELHDPSELDRINWNLYLALEELNLSGNRLTGMLSLPLFLASQTKLDLRNNALTTIRLDEWNLHSQALQAEAAHQQSQSASAASISVAVQHLVVQLANNPINCNCALAPLLQHTKSAAQQRFRWPSVTFDLESVRCAIPESLATTSLARLDEQRLSCQLINSNGLCPNECQCEYGPSRKVIIVDCRDRNINQIPEVLIDSGNYEQISLGESESFGPLRLGDIDRMQLLLQHNHIQQLSQLDQLLNLVRPLPTLPHSIRLDLFLDNNSIPSIPDSLFDFVNLPVSALADLHSNTSTPEASRQISPPSLLFTLNTLSLTNNRLRSLSPVFLDRIKAIESRQPDNSLKIYLGSNPYNCTAEPPTLRPNGDADCEALQLKNWLTSNFAIVGDLSEMQCDPRTVAGYSQVTSSGLSSHSFSLSAASSTSATLKADNRSANSMHNARSQSANLQLVQQPDHILCEPPPDDHSPILLFALGLLVVLAVALSIALLYTRNRQTLLAFVYVHLQPIFVCFSLNEDDLDREKLYDAFVSYSSADRDVVMQLIERLERPSSRAAVHQLQARGGKRTFHEANADKIVPEPDVAGAHTQTTLEEDGEHFKLCIHERDWLPGQLISWNIINSVRNSRRTILILSRDFIESIWFQIEFHTAYYQMLEERRDRLIVIIRGDIPDKSQMDRDLAFLLSTKTYLVWGEKWFWHKLRYSLPHKRPMDRSKKAKTVGTSHPLVTAEHQWPDFGTCGPRAGKTTSKGKKQLQQRVDNAIADYYGLHGINSGVGKSMPDMKGIDSIYSEFGMRSSHVTSSAINLTGEGASNTLDQSASTTNTDPKSSSTTTTAAPTSSTIPDSLGMDQPKESGHINKSFESYETQT